MEDLGKLELELELARAGLGWVGLHEVLRLLPRDFLPSDDPLLKGQSGEKPRCKIW